MALGSGGVCAPPQPSQRAPCLMGSGECRRVYGCHSACRSFQNFFWYWFCLGEWVGAAGCAAAALAGQATLHPQTPHPPTPCPAPTMATQSRSSTASYPERSCSTAKLRPSWRRGKATGPSGSGSNCVSASSSALRGPPAAAAAAADCRGGNGAVAAHAARGCSGRAAAAAAPPDRKATRRSRAARPCGGSCCSCCGAAAEACMHWRRLCWHCCRGRQASR